MAKMDEVREDISLRSKLLMVFIGTVVVTVGGVIGVGLSKENWVVFSVGAVATVVLTVICFLLLWKVQQLIQQLGNL